MIELVIECEKMIECENDWINDFAAQKMADFKGGWQASTQIFCA